MPHAATPAPSRRNQRPGPSYNATIPSCSTGPRRATGPQHAVYQLDGAPRTNTLRLVGSGTAAESVVHWQGDTMVVRTVSHPGDGELVQVDHWWLRNAGELRMRREAAYQGSSMGAPTFVFTRQP